MLTEKDLTNFNEIFRKDVTYDNISRRAARGEGGRPPLPFFENQKKCPNFGEKNALVVSILRLNLPFKM